MRLFATALVGAALLAAIPVFSDGRPSTAQSAAIGAVLVGAGYVAWSPIEQQGRGWGVKNARLDEDGRLYDLTLSQNGYGIVEKRVASGDGAETTGRRGAAS